MGRMTWSDIAYSVFTGATVALVCLLVIAVFTGCSSMMKVDVPKNRDVKVYVIRDGLVVRHQSQEAMKCDDPSLQGARVIKKLDWNEVLNRMQYIRLKYASEAK